MCQAMINKSHSVAQLICHALIPSRSGVTVERERERLPQCSVDCSRNKENKDIKQILNRGIFLGVKSKLESHRLGKSIINCSLKTCSDNEERKKFMKLNGKLKSHQYGGEVCLYKKKGNPNTLGYRQQD